MSHSSAHGAWVGALPAVASTLLLTMACGGLAPQVRLTPGVSPTPRPIVSASPWTPGAPDLTPGPTLTPEIGSSRTNPAPPGSEVAALGVLLQVTEITRPADEMIAAAAQENATPEPGSHYILVHLLFTCDLPPDDTCNVYPEDEFSLVGSAGVVLTPSLSLGDLPGLLHQAKFYGGSQLTGYIPFMVPEDETGLVLVYKPPMGLGLYEGYLAVP